MSIGTESVNEQMGTLASRLARLQDAYPSMAAHEQAQVMGTLIELYEHLQVLLAVVSPTASFYGGWRSTAQMTDEEINAAIEEMEFAEKIDNGYLAPEPTPQPDAWPLLTNDQLLAEYGSGVEQ